MSNFCNLSNYSLGFVPAAALSCLAWQLGGLSAEANPTGGTVVPGQGAATFNTSGSQFTINQTSANVLINWSSFNIASGETTTFIQPTASSVAWNQINDPNPSQILGHLNANGFVVLQNQNGFVVGGDASIKASGLVMTTSPTPAPNLSSGGAWEFDAPPPAAQIINYGQISVGAGGSLFLIASDIENRNGTDPQGVNGVGTLSAPGGRIGLYAGQQVLLSTSPNGHGLSAKVTLPEGSVDNKGNLIADGGSIAALAQTVNQNGLVQANAIRNVNGVIELVASGNLTVGANSDIEANGDATSASPSPGGFVVLQAGGSYSDTPSSVVNVSGQKNGQAGIVEILGNNLDGTIGAAGDANSIQSTFGTAPFAFLVNPYDLTLGYSTADTSSSDPTLGVYDLAAYSQIDLHALDDITLTTPWTLNDSTRPAALSLQAGNSIILTAGTSITAGENWSVNLVAGTAFVPTLAQPAPAPAGGDGAYNYGVYLDDGAYVQTQNGDVNVSAVNEVVIHNVDLSSAAVSGAIRTMAGGNITVTTEYNDVDTGNNVFGYDFNPDSTPYYTVDPGLGGISTFAGGNVTINAGGNVNSYLPTQSDYNNYYGNYFQLGTGGGAGTGAFGTEPGNVTISAGGSVLGNYMVANGVGIINAGGNAGLATSLGSENAGFALSLIKGSWSVNAQNIYLDDVLNPNGVFNDNAQSTVPPPGAHNFDYDPDASVSLDAANAVEITGAEVPLKPASDLSIYSIPVLLPPSVSIVTGAEGLTLDTDVILFPSQTGNGNVNITTLDGGNFASRENPNDPTDFNIYTFEMSDSAQTQWSGPASLQNETFGTSDHGPTPLELNNPNPVDITINGNIDDVSIYTTKATDITVNSVTVGGQTVGGNMFNSSLVGENLHAHDATTINVAGSISFSPVYTFVTLSQALPVGWEDIFSQLVDNSSNPSDLNSVLQPIPQNDVGNASAIKNLAAAAKIFPGGNNPGFVYNPDTKQLGYAFQMSSIVRSVLEGTLTAIEMDSSGNPEIQLGQASLGQDPTKYYFVTTTVSFLPQSELGAIETLYENSVGLAPNSAPSVKDAQHLSPGFQLGGPGTFNVNAGSIDLGASFGIVSWGGADGAILRGGVNYAPLGALTDNEGAAVNVTVANNLSMLTSTIASINGGAVTVDDTGGEIDLGLAGVPFSPLAEENIPYGIYTAGAGDVNVTASGAINIDTARIATFNGGNINVESLNGDVNAGNGINLDLFVPFYYYDSKTGKAVNTSIDSPRPYGSGILALSPTAPYQVAPGTAKGGAELPGNITVETPKGNIVSTLGGIAQFALNNNVGGGPTVTLIAGTPGVAATKAQGNINLGQGGVIGGTVNLSAQGNIQGLIVSRQDTTLKAQENVDVTVLSGGSANVSAGGALSGTLIGMGGINASGGQGITATMLSSSVSANGAAAQSTLGAATASAASQSAANQSTTDAKQELASNANPDDDLKKKRLSLRQRVKRVTVILPKT